MSTTVPGLPDATLGWQVLDWCSAFLRQPDGDNAGDRLEFTDEQARFLLDWYAVLIIPALYLELAVLNRAVHGGRYFDDVILSWEQGAQS